MDTAIPIKIIHIPQQGCHIMCELMMADYKINMLIDTGASLTVLDLKRYKKIFPHHELSPYENAFRGITSHAVESYTGLVDLLSFGQIRLKNKKFLLVDLSSINQAYAHYDLQRIDGVLGGDLLLSMRAIIDYAARKILLSSDHLF